jgi:hypothetical protein
MSGERTDSSSVSREAATIIQGPGRAVKGKTMLRFNVTAADGALWEHQVAEDEVVIGRSSKAGLTVPDRSLSRAHARIFRTDDGWRLEDLGSRNGTFLNGQRLEGSVPIKVGDTLTLGSSLISLMAVGTDPSDDTADDLSGHTVLRPARELLDRTQLELPAPTAGRRDDPRTGGGAAPRSQRSEPGPGSFHRSPGTAGADPRPCLRPSQARGGRDLPPRGQRLPSRGCAFVVGLEPGILVPESARGGGGGKPGRRWFWTPRPTSDSTRPRV